jgi:hypothetical protein
VERATIEGALRRAIEQAASAVSEHAALQGEFLANLATHIDRDMLASDEMWR